MFKPKITHKGWFLLCPVLIADVDSDSPYLETRRLVPEWWFSFNAELVDLFMFVAFLLGYEPQYPILISGEVSNGSSS